MFMLLSYFWHLQLAAKYNLSFEPSGTFHKGKPQDDHTADDTEDDHEISDEAASLNPIGRPVTGCTIFLAFTSNCITSGLRDIVRFLAEHNMVKLYLRSYSRHSHLCFKIYWNIYCRWMWSSRRRAALRRTLLSASRRLILATSTSGLARSFESAAWIALATCSSRTLITAHSKTG